jgi:hypothetical protein
MNIVMPKAGEWLTLPYLRAARTTRKVRWNKDGSGKYRLETMWEDDKVCGLSMRDFASYGEVTLEVLRISRKGK